MPHFTLKLDKVVVACGVTSLIMDNVHVREIYDLGDEKKVRLKNLVKFDKIQNLVAKCCNVWKIQSREVCEFCIFLYYVRKLYVTTGVLTISARSTKIYKIRRMRKAILCTLYNISQPNITSLLISLCSLQQQCLIPVSRPKFKFGV